MNSVGARMLVRGMVQGVGFRYFVLRTANAFGLKGFVRNLADGSVEIGVEGDRGLIESFLQEIKTGNSFADVRDVQIEWLPFEGKYRSFEITY